MSIFDWSKAPEWANAVIRSNVGGDFYVSQWGGISARLRIGHIDVCEESADMIPPHNWILIETRHAPWDGNGLPPVGIEIEAMMRRNMHDDYAWRRAKVVHGCIPGSEGEVLVFDVETTSPAWVDEFRLVRTPEQIAEQVRSDAIRQMIRVWGVAPTGAEYNFAHERAAQLYDAGYHKQRSP